MEVVKDFQMDFLFKSMQKKVRMYIALLILIQKPDLHLSLALKLILF